MIIDTHPQLRFLIIRHVHLPNRLFLFPIFPRNRNSIGHRARRGKAEKGQTDSITLSVKVGRVTRQE